MNIQNIPDYLSFIFIRVFKPPLNKRHVFSLNDNFIRILSIFPIYKTYEIINKTIYV